MLWKAVPSLGLAFLPFQGYSDDAMLLEVSPLKKMTADVREEATNNPLLCASTFLSGK